MTAFKKNTVNCYGEKGREWLDNLPSLIARLEAAYDLSDLKPVKNLSYNYVLSGFQNSLPIILKLGLDIDGFKQEAAALKAFSGFGAVQVLIEDNGLLLLECKIGNPLV